MQGIDQFIDTETKIAYINALLEVGFDTLDFGSFVSPKVIPQLRDTPEVIERIRAEESPTRLLAIIANVRGANHACEYKAIKYLGFPFSISQQFQKRNTNSSIEESLERLKAIQDICHSNNKSLVAYLSMGFGNPYGEPWNHEIVMQWVEELVKIDVKTIALSDTIGVSNPENISYLFSHLIPEFSSVEFGAHLHTTSDTWEEKVHAAYINGCTRFDGALKGFGGCPMADDDLVGNMPTENVISYFQANGVDLGLNEDALAKCMSMTNSVFP